MSAQRDNGADERRSRDEGLDQPVQHDQPEAELLAAALADLAPEAPAAIAAAVAAVVSGLADGDRAAAARAIAAGLVAAGAEGAEVYDLAAGRRLAAHGPAVPDGERWAHGRARGFPGPVATVRVGGLAAVCTTGLPGTEARERIEDCAEALLALAALDGDLGLDPAGPLPA